MMDYLWRGSFVNVGQYCFIVHEFLRLSGNGRKLYNSTIFITGLYFTFMEQDAKFGIIVNRKFWYEAVNTNKE